jgi:hypothetical protein
MTVPDGTRLRGAAKPVARHPPEAGETRRNGSGIGSLRGENGYRRY